MSFCLFQSILRSCILQVWRPGLCCVNHGIHPPRSLGGGDCHRRLCMQKHGKKHTPEAAKQSASKATGTSTSVLLISTSARLSDPQGKGPTDEFVPNPKMFWVQPSPTGWAVRTWAIYQVQKQAPCGRNWLVGAQKDTPLTQQKHAKQSESESDRTVRYMCRYRHLSLNNSIELLRESTCCIYVVSSSSALFFQDTCLCY